MSDLVPTLGVYVCDHMYCDVEECGCYCHRIAKMHPNETSAIKVDMSIPAGTMMFLPPRDGNEPLAVWASRAVLIQNLGEPITCANCGLSRNALMFREYEAGTEWSGLPCCDPLPPDAIKVRPNGTSFIAYLAAKPINGPYGAGNTPQEARASLMAWLREKGTL